MQPSDTLERKLCDLSVSLSDDNEYRAVTLTRSIETVHFSKQGVFGLSQGDGHVVLNPNHAGILGADDLSERLEFGLLLNTLSHEIEHELCSDPESKEAFISAYPRRPMLSSTARNLVEDVYIDSRRLSRDRGLRPIQSLFCDLIMDDATALSEHDGVNAYAAAMDQIAKTGHVAGIEGATNALQSFCVTARELFEKARNAHTSDKRDTIAHSLMDELADRTDPETDMPNPQDGDDAQEELEEILTFINTMPSTMEDMDIPQSPQMNPSDPHQPDPDESDQDETDQDETQPDEETDQNQTRLGETQQDETQPDEETDTQPSPQQEVTQQATESGGDETDAHATLSDDDVLSNNPSASGEEIIPKCGDCGHKLVEKPRESVETDE